MNRKPKATPKKYNKYKQPMTMYKQPKVKIDLKYADYLVSANVTNGGTITSLFSNMTRGDNGLNMHNGNIVIPRYITVDYFFVTQQLYNSLRIMVFQWQETTTPTLSTLLQSTTSGIATISPINISAKSEIKVLADHKLILAPSAGGDTTPIGHGVYSGSMYIPERKLKPVRFNASANLIQSQNIYVMFVSDDAVPVYPTLNLYTRVAFTD